MHALCWAHFLRELQYIQDNTKLKFPDKIRNSIFKLKSIIAKNEAEELSLHLGYISTLKQKINEEKLCYPLIPTLDKTYNLLK